MEDLLHRFLALFNRLPLPVRNFTGKLYNGLPNRLKYGSFYYKYLRRLIRFSEFNSAEEIAAAQQQLLFNQINGAIDKVPFYSKYKKPESLEDILEYPVIDKQTIVNSFSEFLNDSLTHRRIVTNTGGTSGTPLEFFIEKNVARPKEKAHFDWYWKQFGYTPNSKMLMIRGKPLPRNRTFEYNPINNILNISCYNVNENNISMVLEKINGFNPQFIHAYPSALKNLTSLLESHKSHLSLSIKALFLGSEQLFESDRSYFEEFYQTKAVNWYGHSERLVYGGNCPVSDEYHFYPAYGYLELLDENDQPITKAGREGRIIATGFDNRVMPFIRYDTGDLGVLSVHKECRCGFKGTSLASITGRGQDFIILSDHTRVSLTAFIFGQHLEAFNRIREMQVVQNRIGEIEIKIVKNDNFTLVDEKVLKSTLMNSVEHKIEVNLTYTDLIPKTHRGKSTFFITSLNS